MEGLDTHTQNHHHHHHNVDILMEEQQHVQGGPVAARGGDGGSSSRWNPEREQINMLENFYRQGIRTPSAEQIQQITSRLRAYGHIEAKNVFYWFQNHKARLRQKQKQKQDSKAAAYHLTARAQLFPISPSHTNFPLLPLPPPLPNNYNLHPSPNVTSNPFYMSIESELGGLHQHPQYPNKVPLPAGVGPAKRRTRTTLKPDKRRAAAATVAASASQYEPMHNSCTRGGGMIDGNRNHETLPLFPLQPTGILQQERCHHENPNGSSSSPHSSTLIGSCEIAGGHHPQPFYDFFSG